MYLSDMHTHSIASGHGTECTITNMARAAAEKGLRLLGITDHGPGTLAAGTSSYFRSLTYSPKKHFGVELLYGIELNILDRSGTVDLDQELLCKLDYAIASMHAWNYRCGTRAENTEAFINVMKNPCVKILGHSDNTHYPVNYDALARAARETGTIFEINEASLAPYGYRGDTESFFVEDQLFRKHGLMNKLSSTGKISDMLRAMAVTGKKQRQIIFAAASKDLETVFSCVATIAIRCKRSFVDLKDRAGFPGSPCKRIIINRVMSVITMSEDLYTGVFHYIDKSFCVFGSVPQR